MIVCVDTVLMCSGYGSSKNSIISGSTESLDDDEENLLEVEDVGAYLRFNKEVRHKCFHICIVK